MKNEIDTTVEGVGFTTESEELAWPVALKAMRLQSQRSTVPSGSRAIW